MSFTVRMLFEGVVAAVPDMPLDFTTPASVGVVEIFVPDLRKTHDSGRDVKAGIIRTPHYFWIEIERDRLSASSTRTPDLHYRPGTTGSELAVFLLNNTNAFPETFTLKTAGPPQSLDVNQTMPRYPDDPRTAGTTAAERRSLWWILRPGDLTGDANHGKWKALGTLTARFHLTAGKVFVPGFSNGGDVWPLYEYYHPSSGTPNPTTAKYRRAIGNQVAVDLLVDSFALVSNDSAGHEQVIEIKPPSSGRVVVVRLRNVEPEAIVGAEVSPGGPDPDFAEFYRNSAGAAVYPWVLPLVPATVGDKERPCAPALFASK